MKTTHITAISAAIAAVMMSYAPVTLAAPSDILKYELEANIGENCYVPAAATAGAITNAAYTPNYIATPNTGGGTFNFDLAVNTDTAAMDTSSAPITYAGAWCNYAASISVKSTNGGMTPAAATATLAALTVAGTFAPRIDYTAEMAFCGQTTSLTTTGTAADVSTLMACGGPNIGDLVLTLSTAATTVPLVAGDYEDVLEVKIGVTL